MQNWKVAAKRLQYALIFFYGLVIAFALNDFLQVRKEIKEMKEGGSIHSSILGKFSECGALEWKAQPECLSKANAEGKMKILPSYGSWLASQRAMGFIDHLYKSQSGLAQNRPITNDEEARKYKLAAYDYSLAIIHSRLIEFEDMTSRKIPDALSIHLSSLLENVMRRMFGQKFHDGFQNDFKVIEENLRKDTDMELSEAIVARLNELRALRDRYDLLESRERALLDQDAFGGWVLARVQPYVSNAVR